ATARPMVFVAIASPKQARVAMDLESAKTVWTQPAQVTSRVVVGKDVVVCREGAANLVGRDVRTGAPVWRTQIPGTLLGVAIDEDRVYYSTQGSGGRSGIIAALGARSGDELWHKAAEGSLGAPAAR